MRDSVPISQCQLVLAAHEGSDREPAWLLRDHHSAISPILISPIQRAFEQLSVYIPSYAVPRIRVIFAPKFNLRFCFVTDSTPIILGQYYSIIGTPNECFQSHSALGVQCSKEPPLPSKYQSPGHQWGGSLCMPLPRGSSVGRSSDGPNRVPEAPANTDGEAKDLIGK